MPGTWHNYYTFRDWNSELNWLEVSTHLKNISQIGNLLQLGVKINKNWNHHLVNLHLSHNCILGEGCRSKSSSSLYNQVSSLVTWYIGERLGATGSKYIGNWIFFVLGLSSLKRKHHFQNGGWVYTWNPTKQIAASTPELENPQLFNVRIMIFFPLKISDLEIEIQCFLGLCFQGGYLNLY